jgi:S1-C subfamily serine protease
MTMHRTILTLGCTLVFASSAVNAQVPEGSPRMTPLVQVIAMVEPAVVALFVPDPQDSRRFSSGSGVIVHPDGYALTNDHVVRNNPGFAVLRGQKPQKFRVVGRSPEKDLAVIQVLSDQTPLPTVALGRSDDVLVGETVAVVGNPGGRGTIVTSGIISSMGTHLTVPNGLWASQADSRWRDDFIQFDAATNRGNSGGPVINMESKLIGIVAALIPTEQNSNFAIPIDRARRLIERMVEPELMHGKLVGLTLNPYANEAVVIDVAPDSPAASAGIKSGDVLKTVGGQSLNHSADWTFALDRLLPLSKPLAIDLQRGAETLTVSVLPTRLEARAAKTEIDLTKVSGGLQFEFYEGEYKLLPDFANLKPARKGVAETLDLTAMAGKREDYFAVRLKGYMEVPDDGLYRLHLSSDDGSRFRFGEELFLDHDGNHPAMALSRLCRMKAGLHPIVIDYFEGYGEHILEVKLERIDVVSEAKAPTFKHDAE